MLEGQRLGYTVDYDSANNSINRSIETPKTNRPESFLDRKVLSDIKQNPGYIQEVASSYHTSDSQKPHTATTQPNGKPQSTQEWVALPPHLQTTHAVFFKPDRKFDKTSPIRQRKLLGHHFNPAKGGVMTLVKHLKLCKKSGKKERYFPT